jgi:hypothetical protein
MHKNMTHVYSGGLMYEYSMEPNGYGIVKIEGGDVKGGIDHTGKRVELDEFDAFQKALKDYPAPDGDGGYNPTSKASECPPKDEHWDVEPGTLPDIPEGAKKYFETGAGKGPGLKGPGSQWATDQASTGENGETGPVKDGDKNAAAVPGASLVVSGLAVVLSVLGGMLL